ncbi:protease inhibitor I42 family protein [Serratia proteamaculans]|uniref:protease inhibitor I42 family protein n=1 Tax=Serratia proteamaculans TaxID=28151 RepID=UPI0036F34B10
MFFLARHKRGGQPGGSIKITRHSLGALLILALGPLSWGAEQKELPSPDRTTCLRAQVVVHNTFTVALDGTPASGYGWRVFQLPAQLKLKNTDYTPARHCLAGITGCHGVQTFVFEVVTPGAGTLQWSYGRMWAVPSHIAHCIDIIALPSPTALSLRNAVPKISGDAVLYR